MRRVCLANAAAELGISVEALIDRLVGGAFGAAGREYGEDMPIPIPPQHFAVPLREKRKASPDDMAALIQLGYAIPSGWTGPVNWVDHDYDERTGPVLGSVLNVRPPTCLDIEGCSIYADGAPRWTDIHVKLPDAHKEPKALRFDIYASYQRETKKNTGHWSSNVKDTAWANENNYSRDSVRDARKQFKATLSAAARQEFEKPGPRN